MAYSIEIKKEIIKKIAKGEKVKNISEEMKISLPTIYKWKKEFETNNKNPNEQKETSKEIKKLIKLRKYNKALRLTEKYPLNPIIQSQKIKIYIKIGNYEKAKEIGQKFEDNVLIQSQMVTIAIKEGNYDKAKKIGQKFEDNAPIQSQIEKMLMEQYEEDEKLKAIEQLKEYNPFQQQIKNEKDKSLEYLNKLKTKIYYGIEGIDIQEILQNKEITEYQKLYVLLAIYEKNRKVNEIKNLAKQYKESKESKNINSVLQRTQSKKKHLFDWEIYDNCLGWVLDENLKNEYDQERKRQEEIKRNVNKQETKEQEKKIKKNTQVQKRQENENEAQKQVKNNSQKSRNFREQVKVQVQQNSIPISRQKKLDYNCQEVLDFLLEKRKEIYIKMQSKDLKVQREGIEQWDKIEILIEKTKQKKDDENYMKELYEKVSKLKDREKELNK